MKIVTGIAIFDILRKSVCIWSCDLKNCRQLSSARTHFFITTLLLLIELELISGV